MPTAIKQENNTMRWRQHLFIILWFAGAGMLHADDCNLAEIARTAADQYRAGKYRDAITSYRAVLPLVSEKDYPTGIPFRLYYGLGECYLEQEQYREALAAFRQAVEIAWLGPYDEYTLFDAYESIMCLGLQMQQPAITVEYGSRQLEALKRYPPQNHFFTTVNCRFLLGEGWLASGAYPEAIANFTECLNLLHRYPEKNPRVNINAYIGLVLAKLSMAESGRREYPAAMNRLREVLELFTAVPALTDADAYPDLNRAFAAAMAPMETEKPGDTPELGRFFQDLAGYYQDHRDHRRFTHYQQKALRVFLRQQNAAAAAASRAELAAAQLPADPARAAATITAALKMLPEKVGRSDDAARVFFLAGKIFRCRHQPDRSRYYLLRAAAALPQLPEPLPAARILTAAGQLLQQEQSYRGAIRCLRLAIDYARQNDSEPGRETVMQALTQLTAVLREAGQTTAALQTVQETLRYRRKYFR
ncbi:MAG: tetratricopeptide repeat protein, partial [Victivallales bacterium]|nr:tetratricopeptide repeat protein [Victivallales bacterium]